MKCPKCRGFIALEATSCSCGWQATTAKSTEDKPGYTRAPYEPKKPMPPEVRQELEAFLARARASRERREEAKAGRQPLQAHPGVEVTEGHGGACYCELCYPKRIRTARQTAEARHDEKRDTEDGQIFRGEDAPDVEPGGLREPVGASASGGADRGDDARVPAVQPSAGARDQAGARGGQVKPLLDDDVVLELIDALEECVRTMRRGWPHAKTAYDNAVALLKRIEEMA